MLKKVIDYLRRFSNFLEKITGYVSMGLVAVMLAVVMIQVILRFFKASVPWSEELSRMLLIWIGMLGAGIAAKEGLHVGVDFLITLLPRSLQKTIGILINLILIAFLIFFTYQGYLSAVAAKRVMATTFEITLFFPKLALPVGSILIAYHLFYFVVKDIYNLLTGAEKGVK